MVKRALPFCILLTLAAAVAAQDTAQSFAPETIKTGSATYARHCAACHGPRMRDPEGSFDLRKFPRDGRERFVTSVMKGKNSMPPWAGLLSPAEVDALWAYLVAGEQN